MCRHTIQYFQSIQNTIWTILKYMQLVTISDRQDSLLYHQHSGKKKLNESGGYLLRGLHHKVLVELNRNFLMNFLGHRKAILLILSDIRIICMLVINPWIYTFRILLHISSKVQQKMKIYLRNFIERSYQTESIGICTSTAGGW